jgi:hypothetical protein
MRRECGPDPAVLVVAGSHRPPRDPVPRCLWATSVPAVTWPSAAVPERPQAAPCERAESGPPGPGRRCFSRGFLQGSGRAADARGGVRRAPGKRVARAGGAPPAGLREIPQTIVGNSPQGGGASEAEAVEKHRRQRPLCSDSKTRRQKRTAPFRVNADNRAASLLTRHQRRTERALHPATHEGLRKRPM